MMDPSQKETKIRACLDQSNVNLWELRELALTQGGLMNADLRREAWCHLVGIKADPVSTTSTFDSSLKVPSDELDLIRQDVFRSVLFHYDKSQSGQSLFAASGESSSQNEIAPYQESLIQVLETVISQPVSVNEGEATSRDRLHYYQGLHDVAGVLLHNLKYDVSLTSGILRQVCSFKLRDAMGKDLKTMTWFLQTAFLEPVLHQVDVELHQFLFLECQVDLTNTVLSWLIAWFTHDVHDEEVASRLVDAFLASHALMPMYLCVAILIHPTSRQEIISGDCDPTSVHMTIRGLLALITGDWNSGKDAFVFLKTQDLLDNAMTLMSMIPPDSILSLASRYDEYVDFNQAEAMYVMKPPPSWAVASRSSGINEGSEASDAGSDPHAFVACGAPDVLNKSPCRTEIVSQRLSPSKGLVSTFPSVRRLSARVLCSNLEQERKLRSQCTPTMFCYKVFPSSCRVFGIRFRNFVRVVVFCWNPSGMFIMTVRKRNSRVKVKKICHSRAPMLRHTLTIISFSTAFMQVVLNVTIKTSTFLAALLAFQYFDTWLLNHVAL